MILISRRKRKGQLFVVTMIFLVSLLFSVQSLLFNYSETDLSIPPQNSDTYIMKNMESIFQTALDSSAYCNEARENVIILKDRGSILYLGSAGTRRPLMHVLYGGHDRRRDPKRPPDGLVRCDRAQCRR